MIIEEQELREENIDYTNNDPIFLNLFSVYKDVYYEDIISYLEYIQENYNES